MGRTFGTETGNYPGTRGPWRHRNVSFSPFSAIARARVCTCRGRIFSRTTIIWREESCGRGEWETATNSRKISIQRCRLDERTFTIEKVERQAGTLRYILYYYVANSPLPPGAFSLPREETDEDLSKGIAFRWARYAGRAITKRVANRRLIPPPYSTISPPLARRIRSGRASPVVVARVNVSSQCLYLKRSVTTSGGLRSRHL